MRKLFYSFIFFTLIVFFASTAHAQYGRVYGVAGESYGSYGVDGIGDGCHADSAFLSDTYGITVDASGNVYISDEGHNLIRKVDATTGIITVFAGTGTIGFSGDGGLAVLADIEAIGPICKDAANNIYIIDVNRIREINATTGIINTVAGTGDGYYSGDGGLATDAGIGIPLSVYVDLSGNIFIGSADARIRKVDVATGIINTIAGDGTPGFFGDGGAATSAEIYFPRCITGDTSGNIYFSDESNNRIRKISATGIITTIAGTGPALAADGGYTGDGGPAVAAELEIPCDISIDVSGNVYFSDQRNSIIRKIDAVTGIITKVAGVTDDGSFDAFSGLWTTGVSADSDELTVSGLVVVPSGDIYYTSDEAAFKITGASSAINTLSVTDSLGTTSCTLPAVVSIGISGTVNGIPSGIDSVHITVDYGEFASNSIKQYTLPYWYTSVYGFGSIFSNLGSYTYTLPGTYTPKVTISTLGGFSDIGYASTIIVGSICDSAITSIHIDSIRDSITTLPCDFPAAVVFKIWGDIPDAPLIGDSIYIAYQYGPTDTFSRLHIVPIVLSGGIYNFTDTLHAIFDTGYYDAPLVQCISSSGRALMNVSFSDFTVNSCTSGSSVVYVYDTASTADICTLPYADQFNISGNLYGAATASTSVSLYVNFGDGSDTTLTAPVHTSGVGDFKFGNYDPSLLVTPIVLSHIFTAPGIYATAVTATAGIYSGTGSATTLSIGSSCSPLSGILYLDVNGDCIHETSEPALNYWPYALINTTLNDTSYGWCNDSGYYSLELIDGDTYTMVVDPFHYFGLSSSGEDSIYASCPLLGTYSVTATLGSSYLENFAFSCAPPDNMDMKVAGWGWGFVPGDTGIIGVWSSDAFGYICDSLWSTITLTIDPHLTYAGMWDGPLPTTILGSTLSWIFSTDSADLFDFYADVKVICDTTVAMGTPICNILYVAPSSLPDLDLANNTYNWCEPVMSSWDPNEKQVSPQGLGEQGYIANGTELSYLIHFQNTGTAMARNITVIDTISSYLDIGTLQVLNSSSPVLVYQDEGTNVVRFRFNDIDLPDSLSNPIGSIGYIGYSISPKPDLAQGTQITNKADIYFDYNHAVVTNATLNTIDTGVTESVKNIVKFVSATIYPNPANDILTIKMDQGAYNSFTIANGLGQVMQQKALTATLTNIDIKSFAPGIYYITLKGDNGTKVQKFVKM